jgi:2'-5' RNA ligase
VSSRWFGVAIGLPEPCTSELQRWREDLGDPNACGIPPHVTLLPPTCLDEGELAAVEEHLRDVAAAERPFEVHLRGSASFRPVSPVVFLSLVEGIGDCERVEEQVRSGPLQRELRFPYHPHVTVAHDLDDRGWTGPSPPCRTTRRASPCGASRCSSRTAGECGARSATSRSAPAGCRGPPSPPADELRRRRCARALGGRADPLGDRARQRPGGAWSQGRRARGRS